ncbi:MAG: PEGA domain-containing protein, partial [Phycisphaerales bacterium]|nr:PEGA domain-containing protein [Phycisphaerales bacterium]
MMRRAPSCRALVLLAAAAPLAGCVDRRIVITSEPPGAMVTLNDAEVGRTPTEVSFTYFGVYDVRLEKPGYDTLITRAEARAPIYEKPGIDLVAMAVPVTKRTIVEWHFTLQPETTDPAAMVRRGAELRAMLPPLT